ncbi:hypothetical protein GALMADRAFT_159398 [Galerina marginata CBS 339.88]|uniref:F-box domain-containing protein n=1 Tax=Galerina marginata (strain CBS 339.88) TaxID=685588 RepID=A0A067SKV1_GALM3|nr:hypothetical protein GALMADRAFT_159398 [Galerina marginata CBS 339.88]
MPLPLKFLVHLTESVFSRNPSNTQQPTNQPTQPISPRLTSRPEQNFALNQDLLWRILNINADMDLESEGRIPALTTLRRASQVSSFWRELVLSSPSLWGKVINLDHLNQETADWRGEVLRRAGESPLHLKGTTGITKKSAKFFASVLVDHWERIQILNLDPRGEINYIGAQLLVTLFSRPAPFLQSVTVPSLYFNKHLVVDDKYHLFSNKAPSLRHFKPFSAEIPAHLEAPWIPQLRSFYLMHPVTSRQLLEAFATMPLLEKFTGKCYLTADPEANSLPAVTLCHLNQIIVDPGDSKEWINILSKITPAAACSLNFILSLRSINPITTNELFVACRVLSTYSQRYFNIHKRHSICLRIAERLFNLYEIADNLNAPPTSEFAFYLSLRCSPFPTHASSTFFSHLTLYPWDKVEYLILAIEDNPVPSDSNLIKTLSSLTSLQSLTLKTETLQLLVEIPPDIGSTLFPSLRQLNYSSLTPRGGLHPDALSALKQFLTSREALRRPIEALELQGYVHGMSEQDFQFLDAFVGLRVVWWVNGQKKEHVCGSMVSNVVDSVQDRSL